MIGLLVVTHDTLGSGYEKLMEHFFGRVPAHVRVLPVSISDEPEHIRQRAHALVAELNSGHGVLILTDIFGATPCNVAHQLVHQEGIGMITGLNAPMMVKAVQYCTQKEHLGEFMQEVQEAAIRGIMTFDFKQVEECS